MPPATRSRKPSKPAWSWSNNKPVASNYKIRPLDEIICYSDKEAHGEEIVPEQMPLNIQYEDEEVMIIK